MVRVVSDGLFRTERLDVELDVLDKVQPGTVVTVRAKVNSRTNWLMFIFGRWTKGFCP